MARVFVDTSAVFALLDRSDANHATARDRLELLKRRRAEPLLTNFIVAESHALALGRLGADIARRWLLGNVWPVERVTEDDESKATATSDGTSTRPTRTRMPPASPSWSGLASRRRSPSIHISASTGFRCLGPTDPSRVPVFETTRRAVYFVSCAQPEGWRLRL